LVSLPLLRLSELIEGCIRFLYRHPIRQTCVSLLSRSVQWFTCRTGGYLSVKLDDLSFRAPIYATLAEVEAEDGLQLIWSRSNQD